MRLVTTSGVLVIPAARRFVGRISRGQPRRFRATNILAALLAATFFAVSASAETIKSVDVSGALTSTPFVEDSFEHGTFSDFEFSYTLYGNPPTSGDGGEAELASGFMEIVANDVSGNPFGFHSADDALCGAGLNSQSLFQGSVLDVPRSAWILTETTPRWMTLPAISSVTEPGGVASVELQLTMDAGTNNNHEDVDSVVLSMPRPAAMLGLVN